MLDCSGIHLDSFLSCHSREEIKVNLPPYRVIKSLCLPNTQCEPKAWMLIRSAISSSFFFPLHHQDLVTTLLYHL